MDKLKQALGQNTREGLLNNNSSNSCDNFDATCDYSSLANNNDDFNSTRDKEKSNLDFEGLPDNYLCGGLPDKMLMEALKELNIS